MEGSENRLECALADRAKYLSVEAFLVRQISYEPKLTTTTTTTTRTRTFIIYSAPILI